MNTKKRLAATETAVGSIPTHEGFLFSDLSADVHRRGQSKAGCQRREAQTSERLGEMPPKYRPTYRRAIDGKSLRASINSFCLECCGWQSTEVTHCTDMGCPLYAVRPYQDGSGNDRDGQFIDVDGPNGAEDA